MKKKLLFTCMAICYASMTFALGAGEYFNAEEGGRYKIISAAKKTVEVTYGNISSQNNYTVPQEVTYEGIKYTVIGIGERGLAGEDRHFSTINLPKTLTYIGDYAFRGSYFETITIPESVTSIGIGAFYNCAAVSSIKLPSNITEIKDETFYNCKNSLKTLTIPNNVKSIGKKAFYFCENLESVIIPKGCTTIGENAFNRCYALKSIVFPNTIEDIGTTAFNYCSQLEEIIITTPVPPAGSIGQTSVSVKGILVPDKSQYMEHDYWAGYNIVEMVTYDKNEFEYNGKEPEVNFTNNLEYEMQIEPYHLQKEAGTYTENITINYYKDSELYFSFEYPYTYTIKKAPLQVEIGNSMKEYGQENPEFTYTITGFVNGETVSSLEEMPEIKSTATQYSEVGMYPITATIKTNNYEPQITNGVLAITKKPLLIIANDQKRKYKESNPAFDVTFNGFVGEDDKEVLTKAPTIECNATIDSETGEYSIIPSGAEAKNYSFNYINGTLTIEPATQEITWEQDFSNINAGDKIQLSAESSSKLPITYTSSDESIASISQTEDKYYLNCLKPGNIIIYAIQNGNNNYESATAISKEISIQTAPTGIDYIYTQEEIELENAKVFDISGRKLAHPHKGLNIIKTPDGTIKKVMKK